MAKKRKSNAEEVPAKAIKPDPELQQSTSSDAESECSSSSESESESESSSSSSSEEVEEEKESPPPSSSSSSSSSSEEEEEEEEEELPKQETIKELLQPFSKDQLITILKDAVSTDPSIASQIISSVDTDPVHRKIFVHGLAWDVTRETLMSSFKPFGTILECRVVTDKLSGRSKGYGFVLFKTRAAARKALKEPQKKIGSRMAACQLASSGARRLYVANVGPQISPEKLRAFFEKFGEIEEGPLGFDKVTGKFKGYALFVYKNLEGVRKALEEAVKVFDGVKLECSLAVEGRGGKTNLAVGQSVVVSTAANTAANVAAVPAQGIPGLAAALNPGLVGQNLNASAVLLGQNPALGILSSAFGVNPSGLINPVGLPSTFVGGVSQPLNRAPNAPPQALNFNGINPSVIGSYGSQAALLGLGAHQNQSSQQGLGAHQNQSAQQGLGAHQNQSSQQGQSSSSFPVAVRPQTGIGTFPPYLGR